VFTGEPIYIRARAVINATGPFSDKIRQLANPQAGTRLRPSKGVHILFSRDLFPSNDALLVPQTEDKRVIFAVPWQDRLLVGTTDDEATAETRMVVERDEAEYLLRQLNPYLANPLRLEQVVSGMAGLRPLVAAAHGNGTKELIRDHEVEVDEKSGLISILGGKWTTHRMMAEDAINTVQRALGVPVTASATKQHLLDGAKGFSDNYWQTLVREYNISEKTGKHLANKFGANAKDVLEIAKSDAALGEPLVRGLPALRAEVIYAMRAEMAQTIEDILARRIGLQLYDWREAIAAALIVGEMLAMELGWSEEGKAQEISAYTAKLRAFQRELGLSEA
jgi:glycerol-3-phosphate dehydrogenase